MKWKVGDRVRVAIAGRNDWSADAAHALDGCVGEVESIMTTNYFGRSLECPRAFVVFDEPARAWWSYQTPPRGWHFEEGELVAENARQQESVGRL